MFTRQRFCFVRFVFSWHFEIVPRADVQRFDNDLHAENTGGVRPVVGVVIFLFMGDV